MSSLSKVTRESKDESKTNTPLYISDDWECKKCTFINAANVPTCTLCGEIKTQTWICKKCTFINVGEKICEMCNIAKESKSDDESWNCPLCDQLNMCTDTFCKRCSIKRQTDPIPVIKTPYDIKNAYLIVIVDEYSISHTILKDGNYGAMIVNTTENLEDKYDHIIGTTDFDEIIFIVNGYKNFDTDEQSMLKTLESRYNKFIMYPSFIDGKIILEYLYKELLHSIA